MKRASFLSGRSSNAGSVQAKIGEAFAPPTRVTIGAQDERNTSNYSELEHSRLHFHMPIPKILEGSFQLKTGEVTSAANNVDQIKALFPKNFGQPAVEFVPASGGEKVLHQPMNIGCVLSGGQAAGGHNCIVGLFDYVEKHAPGSKIFGFLGGPKGVMTGNFRILDAAFVDKYRNTGGFDMLTAGRDKIESPDQFEMARNVAIKNNLDGLVVIGGDDSNTNAAVLGENFKEHSLKCKVIGLPKTIDGDLKNEYVETSFGFDTASKIYAECVGNIQTDCMSTKKYYHFIRIMGREASHLALEVALQTRPNLLFVGEEVRAKALSIEALTKQLADMIENRSKDGKDYGVVLIPEGLIDFIPEVNGLIKDINEVLGAGCETTAVTSKLQPANKAVFEYLPAAIQEQLLLDRDPHGNVQVAKIESERLFALLAENELARRKEAGGYKGKFDVQCHYFGYEGRCAPPSDFDCQYCYVLGLTAGALIGFGQTGMLASIRNLYGAVEDWKVCGMPLTHMMNIERRKGADKPVIKKALTELDGNPFKAFCSLRDDWMANDRYRNPGPLQYGVGMDEATFTLRCEQLGVEAVRAAITADGKLGNTRKDFEPPFPSVFANGTAPCFHLGEVSQGDSVIEQGLPQTGRRPAGEFRSDHNSSRGPNAKKDLRLGIVFSGRQTPGAHTAVAGMKKFLDAHAGAGSSLFGFVGGLKGLFAGKAKQITDEVIRTHANQGGFEMLGRSADTIRGDEQYKAVAKTCTDLKLDGLVVLGGCISMCDAGILAEELINLNCTTRVIGLPGTIDGDLKGDYLDASFGYDTACRTYAQIIGNLQTDAASARKYYYFIRLMGRSPSQIALECGLQTQPNAVLIGEEIEGGRMTLQDIVNDLADLVEKRYAIGKNFGVIVIPEGLVEYIPELRTLLREISEIYASSPKATAAEVQKQLSPWAAAMFTSLPETIRKEMLLTPEASSGGAQLSQIETERLLAELVGAEMSRRKADANNAYDGSFSPVSFFLGYQARSGLPSNFDCSLSFSLGMASAALVAEECNTTGYMATACGLTEPVERWRCGGVPISALLSTGRRAGQNVAVLAPTRVDLQGNAFQVFKSRRVDWQLNDCYRNPGPQQFSGPLANVLGECLRADHQETEKKRKHVEQLIDSLQELVLSPNVLPSMLDAASTGLSSLSDVLHIVSRAEDVARGVTKARRGSGDGGFAAMSQAALSKLADT